MSDDNLIENLREALAAAPGDLSYPFLRSAIVVPLIQREGSVEIVFELRTRHLRRSPGEVGFPGGRVEAEESPLPRDDRTPPVTKMYFVGRSIRRASLPPPGG